MQAPPKRLQKPGARTRWTRRRPRRGAERVGLLRGCHVDLRFVVSFPRAPDGSRFCATMTSHALTHRLSHLHHPQRRQFVRITEDVEQAVDESGVQEGMVLVSAMHITAGVWVNDDEPGILEDTLEWLDKLAPPSWRPPANDVAAQLSPRPRRLPPPPRRRGQRRRALQEPARPPPGRPADHRRAAWTSGPWQAVFYCEFDGGRPKRLVIKVLGE